MKKYNNLIAISAVLLFLSSCIFFQNINQPSKSAPNEIVSVTIIATTQGGSSEPYFGVCLPIGWSVPGDSVRCGGAYEEVIYYDTLVTFNQESVSPAPSGYYWWAGKGIPDETAVGTVYANLKIQTDSQLGVFSIDYMLGDGYNGVNYERSNGHLIEITTDPLILFVNPEKGYQNFSLDMNILGLNTHFSDGTGTDNVWLSKDNDEISANSFVVNSNTSIDANFSIPLAAGTGLWDINAETDIDGIITKAECFNILPSPPIIVVSPDSIYIEVLPGTSRTKEMTIGNTGLSNLSFNVGAMGGGAENFALQYNGFDSYVDCDNDTSLNIGRSITVEAWIYAFDWNGNRRILQKETSDDQYRLLAEDYLLRFEVRYVNNGQISSTLPSTNEWHHIAGVYDYDSSLMRLFIDGEMVAENINVTGMINTSTDPLYIGTKFPGAPSGDYFNGIMDEIRIWATARSQAQIQESMSITLTGLEPELVGYWQFNEGIGDTTFDKTPNANNGILYGGIGWIESSAPIPPGWLSVSPDSGICNPNSSMEISLHFDATELDTGHYYSTIYISNNDPFQPLVEIPIHLLVSTTAVVEDEYLIPTEFYIYQNYPNPFNPTTTIKYSLPVPSRVTLKIYNTLGEEVETLVNKEQVAGNYEVVFNATNLSSGVYFYRLKTDSFTETKKLILLK